MAGSVQRQKVYVQVTELCLLTKALRAASIPPESPAKARQINRVRLCCSDYAAARGMTLLA